MIEAPPTTLLGPDGLPVSIVELLQPPRPTRQLPIMPERGWWTIRTRHHATALLLPEAGDPILDRYFVAAAARDTLDADWRDRRAKMREARKRKR